MTEKEDRSIPQKQRYGTEELYRFLLWTCIVLALVRLPLGRSPAGHILLTFTLLLGAFAVFRIFSCNLPRRRQENRLFLLCKRRLEKFLHLQYLRLRDRHIAAYRTCPECRAVIRLKKRRGEHKIICPRCDQQFDIHIR